MAEQPQTVVDYAAWRKGYMPPTEHVLIDQLSYRGARVVMSSDWGEVAYWLVVRGERLHGRKLLAVRRAIEDALDALAAEGSVQRFAVVPDGPNRFVLVDSESDDPAPVYETEELAKAALAERLAETSNG